MSVKLTDSEPKRQTLKLYIEPLAKLSRVGGQISISHPVDANEYVGSATIAFNTANNSCSTTDIVVSGCFAISVKTRSLTRCVRILMLTFCCEDCVVRYTAFKVSGESAIPPLISLRLNPFATIMTSSSADVSNENRPKLSSISVSSVESVGFPSDERRLTNTVDPATNGPFSAAPEISTLFFSGAFLSSSRGFSLKVRPPSLHPTERSKKVR